MNFKYYKTGNLIIFLVILYIVLSPVANWIKHLANTNTRLGEVIDLIDPLSKIGLITIIMTFINQWGWRYRLCKFLVDIPNLNGRFEGTLESSYVNELSGERVIKFCVLEIMQTASSIHMHAYFGEKGSNENSSTSTSISEQIIRNPDDFFSLYYIFSNKSSPLHDELNDHMGAAIFDYLPDQRRLEGQYFNQRKNKGKITVDFVQAKLLGRLVK